MTSYFFDQPSKLPLPTSLVNDFPVYNIDFSTGGNYHEAKRYFMEELFSDPEAKDMARYNDENKTIEIYCFPRVFFGLVHNEIYKQKIHSILPRQNITPKDPYQIKNLYALFDANFMTEKYQKFEIEKFNKAASYFDSLYSNSTVEEPEFDFEMFERDEPQDHQTYSRICNKLFQGSFGIAEAHNANGPRNFLLRNLPYLQDHIVFREGIYYEAQDLIDSFLNDPAATEISPFLRKLFSYTAYNDNKEELLYECKKLGLRLVGIDTHFSYRSQAFIDHTDNYFTSRMKAMNVYGLAIIKKTMEKASKEKKCLISAGAAHLKALQNSNVPGMCSILKIPTLNVMDIFDENISNDSFYLVHESQFPNFEAHLTHVLKARCIDDKVYDNIKSLIEEKLDDLIPSFFQPSTIRYDIQIEAIPSAKFNVSETPSKKPKLSQ